MSSDSSCQTIKLANGSKISFDQDIPEHLRLKGATPPPVELNLISYIDYVLSKNNSSHTTIKEENNNEM